MVNRFRAFGALIRTDFRQLFHSAKLYIMLASVTVGLMTCFGGMRNYLQGADSTVNPLELFAVCLSNRVSLWIVYFGLVVLIADAPFRRKGDIQLVLRTSRRTWLSAQLIYASVCCVLYLLFILLFFFCLSAGHWSFSSSWSEVFRLASSGGSESVGIVFGIVFLDGFLTELPLCIFLKALSLFLLYGIFTAMLLTLFHLIGKPKAGHVLCAVFPMIDYLLTVAFCFPWCEAAAKYLSPYSLTYLTFLQPVNKSGASLPHALAYLGMVSLLVLILVYRQIRRYDYYTAQ